MHELSSGTEHCVRNSLNTFSEMPSFSDPCFCLSHNKYSHFLFQKNILVKSQYLESAYTTLNGGLLLLLPLFLSTSYLSDYSLLTHNHLSKTHTFSFIQSTVAARTPPLWAVRRRGDLRHLEGTPGEAPDQQVTHRWAQGSHKA